MGRRAGAIGLGVLPMMTTLGSPGVSQGLQADLVVDEIVWTPDPPRHKDRVGFVANVTNQGDAAATTFQVRFLLNGTTEVDLKTIASLAAGATVEVTSARAELLAANYTIKVVADSSGLVAESNEGNNDRTESFAVNATRRTEAAIVDEYLARFDVNLSTALPATLLSELGLGVVEGAYGGFISPEDRTASNNTKLREHWSWHAVRTLDFLLLTGKPPDLRAAWGQVDANAYGADFLDFHRELISDYEAWRLSDGYPILDSWRPPACVPDHFAYERPVDYSCSTGDPLNDPHRPSWTNVSGGTEPDPLFGYYVLSDFPTANRLGKSLEAGASEGYHAKVHNDFGGDMGDNALALKDPIFWAWHKSIDEIYEEWEQQTHPSLPHIPPEDLLEDLEAAWSNLTATNISWIQGEMSRHDSH